MNIRGINKTSLIDYPGKISAVLFTGGCNLRCGYCHNPDMARNDGQLESHTNEEVLRFLRKRRALLEGVTITGGEPTLQEGLRDFIRSVRDLGLLVKLDTNGFRPGVVGGLLDEGLLDYAAVDIKTSPGKYPELTKTAVDFTTVAETVGLLRRSGIPFELRSTCVPGYITLEDLREIRDALGPVERYYLQQMISHVNLGDREFERIQPYPIPVLQQFGEFVRTFARIVEVRG